MEAPSSPATNENTNEPLNETTQPENVTAGRSDNGAGNSAAPTPATEEAKKLPPLTQAEFQAFNRLAEKMDYFHNHFRQTWAVLYSACESGRRPSGMTLKQFLSSGLDLTQYLEAHHSIEETYLYPLLARKMPAFRSSTSKKGEDCELLRQHQEIHKGMDVFEAYLRECKNRERELELPVLKQKMDAWGDVLFKHLDQEVRDLGAEEMRKYWTIAEMRAFPI
ncbi:hypothetical protein B0H63DRAFT_526156 [Podospora didyma]|uniref:Hemerythrin-like domain-containing protein n=1 Tax=Podospora didyma TaxID=330526 RepID=A0AAE0KDJ1_9PEZI|nr:hypothetical protein B0H63DRAFT_526156 [Podospora didyma]